MADTDPADGASFIRLLDIGATGGVSVLVLSTNSRIYTLEVSSGRAAGSWIEVVGAQQIPGADDGKLWLTDTGLTGRAGCDRVRVNVP